MTHSPNLCLQSSVCINQEAHLQFMVTESFAYIFTKRSLRISVTMDGAPIPTKKANTAYSQVIACPSEQGFSFHFITYSLGCGASSDSSDMLA